MSRAAILLLCTITVCGGPAFSKQVMTEPEKFIAAIEKTDIRALQKVAKGRMLRNVGTAVKAEFIAISPSEVLDRYRGCKAVASKLPSADVDLSYPAKARGYIIWKCNDAEADASDCYDEAHTTNLLYVQNRIRYLINIPFQTWSVERCGEIPAMPATQASDIPNG